MLGVEEPVRDAPSLGDVFEDADFAPPLATTYAFAAAHARYAYTWFDGRPTLRPAGAPVLRLGDGKNAWANGAEYITARPKNGDGWPDYRPGKNKGAQPACILDVEECFVADFVDVERDGGWGCRRR